VSTAVASTFKAWFLAPLTFIVPEILREGRMMNFV